jgi:FKBP-type peptidyl-prolyl cis-trans isomerase
MRIMFVEENPKKEIKVSYQLSVFIVLLILVAVAVYLGARSSKMASFATPSPSPRNELNFASPTPATSTFGKEVDSSMQEPEQLKIEDLVEGTGDVAEVGKKVIVNYVGTLESGQQFDSSYDRGKPFSFNLGSGEVIKGWDQGVVGMKVGGKRRLIIPPSLAYGDNGIPESIPPKATLIFEVELLKVE